MRVPLVCAIGVSLWSPAALAGQAPAPAALPVELRTHLPAERFGVVSSLSGLPAAVRNELQLLFGTRTLDIADPGQPFEASRDAGDEKVPTRRLVAAACSYEDCLVYYERAGTTSIWRVVLIHWTPNQRRVEWGGVAPGGLTTIHDVRGAILSGGIKSSSGPW